MFYFIRSPAWLRQLFRQCTWVIKGKEKLIYLTFDDGPHPAITAYVLEELKKYGARATFFCIGKNVVAHPAVYQQIIEAGHAVGNHSFNHLNGWQTGNEAYLADILQAKSVIRSNLYRPPYGRIRPSQIRKLSMPEYNLKTVMWSVLSGDFDESITGERCLQHVLSGTGPGSIIVFHDSEKAISRMRYALPKVLEYYTGKGFRFERISL